MSSPAPALSPRQIEEARAVRGRVLEVMPDAMPFIEDLVREGLIRGWRDVRWAGTLEEGEERHRRYFAEHSLNARQFKALDDLINLNRKV